MFKKLTLFLEMIKFEHTLFALPFAYMGAILGSVVEEGHMPSWPQIIWITIAMIGARTAAMGLNRIIDKTIDANNPRTSHRAIPAGLLSSKEVLLYVIISLMVLFVAAYHLNVLCLELMPIAVFMLVFYSYTKRFTWACHLFLGLTLALAPLGGWVGMTGKIDGISLVLYFTVVFWTSGFDIIYACQDYDYDRKTGLFSIPSRFGIAKALWLAKIFHLLTAIGFLSLYFLIEDLSWIYMIGMIIAYFILIYEHRLVSPQDLSKLNTAFFTMNGVLSMMMFVFTFINMVVIL